jgi:hypothetical protein
VTTTSWLRGSTSILPPDVEQVVAAFGTTYGAVSPDGEDHYPVIVRREIEMDGRAPTLTASDLATIQARTLVMASDDDIIDLEHTLALYRGIEHARPHRRTPPDDLPRRPRQRQAPLRRHQRQEAPPPHGLPRRSATAS